ncbi:MAG: hypothetical protein K8H88_27135 [Sandaracinaceae bacterium]|nr:hypothetical protein [Sandaracinaceae bacterium]
MAIDARSEDEAKAEKKEANRLMISGVTLGAVGALSAVVLGATCPFCVVGAPALVGWGAYRRYRLARAAKAGRAGDEPSEVPSEEPLEESQAKL